MTMTVSITCDDCGMSAETSTSYEAGANEIDGVLDDGWHHEGETDLCPSCSDEAISRRIEHISDYPEPGSGTLRAETDEQLCPECRGQITSWFCEPCGNTGRVTGSAVQDHTNGGQA